MNKSSDYKRIFDHFDLDGNGMISPSELQRSVGLIYHDQISFEDAQVVIQSWSLKSYGELGFEDFISLTESDKEEEKDEDLKKAFGIYKMDGTDNITPKSLNRILHRLGESTTVDECAAMIQQFDLDGDGVINFDEFKADALKSTAFHIILLPEHNYMFMYFNYGTYYS